MYLIRSNTMKHKGWIAIITLLFSSSVLADGFQGEYKCHGEDPYLKTTYTGKITISPQNTVYKIKMEYSTGEKAIGTGGQYNELLLSVVFQDSKDLKTVGLEQYHWLDKEKTKMGGFWVYLGKDKLGKEVCERISG